MLTRKKIVDRACSQAHFVSLKQSMSAATKSYLLGCAIFSRPHEVPNIYGTTWHNGEVYLRQRPLCNCVPVHGDSELSSPRLCFSNETVQALRTQDEVTRAHSSTDAAGLLFEQIESRLPFPQRLPREGVGGWTVVVANASS
ncbi:hypothetical protein GQ600_17437 [Phytophthora cactorum]|nr:hypothetical protein GQ600_17437 [Phytophthora cactorum]